MRAVCRGFNLLHAMARPCCKPPLFLKPLPIPHTHVCRQLLTPRVLGLDKFKEVADIGAEKFGKTADEFKANLVESLSDPEVELLTQDCLSYIYLMTQDDLPYLVQLITRFEEQTAEDKLAQMSAESVRLGGHALRICHLLRSPDTALQVYKIHKPEEKDVVPSLAVLMDLLYECERYSECTTLALDNLVGHVNLSRKHLQPLLTLAFLSCLHLDGPSGLKSGAQLVAEWKKMGGVHVKYVKWLFTSYCIQQGRVNVALGQLTDTDMSGTSKVITENLRALAYIKNNNDLYAFNTLIKLENSLLKDEESTESVMLFDDVFQALLSRPSRQNHVDLMNRVKVNKTTLVHPQSLSSFLVDKLIRYNRAAFGTDQVFPVFGEVAGDDAFYRFVDSLEETEELSSTDQVLIENRTKPDKTVSSESKETDSSDDVEKSKKPQKMVVINGYITFVDADDTKEGNV